MPTPEFAPVGGETVYAITKVDQEKLVLTWGRQAGIPTVALRYSCTFGPRQSIFNPYTGVIAIFCTRLLNNLPPVIYEDGEQTRDFSFVEDIARANFLAATSDQLDGKAVNVGSGRAVTIKQVAEMISEALQIRLAPIMNRELERKESPFQLSQFAQRERQAVLAGIGRELAQDHRGGDCSRFDRQGEAQQFEPMIANDAKIDGARRQRSELGRHGHARQCIESLFLQVANARRKAEAQQTAHGKDMIGEAPGVGVVLVNDKAALVIKQCLPFRSDIRTWIRLLSAGSPACLAKSCSLALRTGRLALGCFRLRLAALPLLCASCSFTVKQCRTFTCGDVHLPVTMSRRNKNSSNLNFSTGQLLRYAPAPPNLLA